MRFCQPTFLPGLLFLLSFVLYETLGQVVPANLSTRILDEKDRTDVILDCKSTNEDPVNVCLWEKMGSNPRGDGNLIITFNSATGRPGVYSGFPGYSYHGIGLIKGECGLKISAPSAKDFTKWECTLVSRDNKTLIYRESINLQKPDNFTEKLDRGNSIAKPRESRLYEFTVGTGSSNTKPAVSGDQVQPIVTGVSGSAAVIADSSVSRSVKPGEPYKGASVQEVEVQSAGLVIVPRKERKLVIL